MFKGKEVLVIGLARAGIAAVEALLTAGANVTINDSKAKEAIEGIEHILDQTKHQFGPPVIKKYDYVVVSPGVPLSLPFVKAFRDLDVPVIGTLEVGYQLSKGHFYGITGTNGKTTTTTLTYNIFKAFSEDSYAVGNIGQAVASIADQTSLQSHLITEVSSFQLETIVDFKVHIAAILNITPDHLNRHMTMENYIAEKCKIYANQNESDYLVLNYDHESTRTLSGVSQRIFFSKTPLEKGFYVENNEIIAHLKHKESIMPVSEIKLLGAHNIENVLAAVAISYLAGIPVDIIRQEVTKYYGVDHRNVYVGTYEGIDCYNDSKGTNPESSIVAVNSMVKPTLLIAGGMDKGSEFDAFTKTFKGKLKHLILFGETKEQIADSARQNGFDAITLVNTLDEAVELSFDMGSEGDALLLSPACASWDMYKSYEIRGEHFKSCLEKRKVQEQ